MEGKSKETKGHELDALMRLAVQHAVDDEVNVARNTAHALEALENKVLHQERRIEELYHRLGEAING